MNDVEILPLATPAGTELTAMTFPAYRHLLALEPAPRHPEQGDCRPVEPLALVAYDSGVPVGLILAELPIARDEPPAPCETSYGGLPAILSVYVAPERRGLGIASRLFERLEQTVAAHGFDQLEAVYTSGRPSISQIERIFARRGWSPPRARSLVMRFSPQLALARPLMSAPKLAAVRRELEIFPWSELGAWERVELERSHTERPWIAPGLEPWRFDRRGFDPSSVGARYRGEVVGWVINHRVNAEIIRFTCSFMHPKLSRRGRIVPLYYAALERLDAKCRECTFITPVSYLEMIEFVRGRLASIASFMGETLGVCLELSPRDA